MRNLMKKSAAAALLVVTAAFLNTACSNVLQAKTNAPRAERRNETIKSAKNSEVYREPARNTAENNFDLSGTWQAAFRVNDMTCDWEATFHPNGAYSSITQCRGTPYSVYYSGSWRMLSENAVRLQYTECSPNRCPVSGETRYFEVINDDQIRFNDRVAYRVE